MHYIVNMPVHNKQAEEIDYHGRFSSGRIDHHKLINTKMQKLQSPPPHPRFCSSIQKCKTRAVLSSDQAVDIFKVHLSNQSLKYKNDKKSSTQVASAYGVSEKTVRDIWSGRTWFHELIHLDPARAATVSARLRPPGRPRIKQMIEESSSGYSSTNAMEGVRTKPGSQMAECPQFQNPPMLMIDTAVASFASANGNTAFASQLINQDAGVFETSPSAIPSLDDHRLLACTVIGAECFAAAEVAPLPVSSSTDDPFHDDWDYWLAKGGDVDSAAIDAQQQPGSCS